MIPPVLLDVLVEGLLDEVVKDLRVQTRIHSESVGLSIRTLIIGIKPHMSDVVLKVLSYPAHIFLYFNVVLSDLIMWIVAISKEVISQFKLSRESIYLSFQGKEHLKGVIQLCQAVLDDSYLSLDLCIL